MMVRHAAVALACLALAHAIAAPAAFCPKVLEPLDRDSDECPDELDLVACDDPSLKVGDYCEGPKRARSGYTLGECGTDKDEDNTPFHLHLFIALLDVLAGEVVPEDEASE